MAPTQLFFSFFLSLLFFFFISPSAFASPAIETLDVKPQIYNPKLPPRTLSSSKKFEGSSDLVNLRYHMGPVLSSPINIYLIWYGKWAPAQQLLIKDFLLSISTNNHRAAPSPSVADWWSTVSLYTDQTGANISRSVLIAGEYADRRYSHGTHLTRLSIQQVIATAVQSKPFPSTTGTGSTSSLPPRTSPYRISAAPFAASTTSPSPPWSATPCPTPGWAIRASNAPKCEGVGTDGKETGLCTNEVVFAGRQVFRWHGIGDEI
ncbi:EXORDIUM like 5 [Actinidia rufa]|uniref:EXORDIUM like 5 n=1 Tax=Actinidia rufa TaxID=165716 RepID=A0A7J0DN94_9ERIC|nr:EXORDIUM like 5 [Actinidia rufa]